MMRRDYVDRALADWIAEQDRTRADYLDEVLARTARTPQRPAWSFPGRWFPQQLTSKRVAMQPGVGYVVLVATLLLALAVAAAAIIGSRRPVAPPFGPASNGLVAYSTPAGDIVTADVDTNAVRVLVGGAQRDTTPVFSRDGTRIAFTRAVDGGKVLYAVDATGGSPVQLTSSPFAEIKSLAWSPDGSRLAFVADARIWMAATDGSGAIGMLPLGEASQADYPVWRPPAGRELLFRGLTTTGYRLFLIPADLSSGPMAITEPQSSAVGPHAWIFPNFSPQADVIVTQRYTGNPDFDTGEYRTTILTLDPGTSRVASSRDATPASLVSITPILSPDGRHILVGGESAEPGRSGLSVVPIDDPGSMRLIWPDPTGAGHQQVWAPDGTAVLLRSDAEADVLAIDPVDGSVRQLPLGETADLDWQRTAP